MSNQPTRFCEFVKLEKVAWLLFQTFPILHNRVHFESSACASLCECMHTGCISRGQSKTARIKRILNNFNYKLKQWFTAINILKMISKYVKDEVIFKNNNYNIIITIKNRLELFFTKNWQTNINGDEFFCILLNLVHLHKVLETAYIIRRSSQNRK